MVNSIVFKPFDDLKKKIVDFDYDIGGALSSNTYTTDSSHYVHVNSINYYPQSILDQFSELVFNYETDCSATISNHIEVKSDSSSFPKMDIYKEDNSVYVILAVAGYSKKEIMIKATDDMLFIAGIKDDTKENDNIEREYIQKQIAYRKWKKLIKLSSIVDVDNIKAKFENGLLKIELPLKKEHKSKIISID